MDNSRIALSNFTAAKASAVDVHKAVCKDIIDHVGSTRASIWYFDDNAATLTCACNLDTRTGVFDLEPFSLYEAESAIYFDEIRSKGVVRASDVQTNAAVQSLNERYISPLGIVSLFDWVIKIGPKAVAVLCCEQCGAGREWSAADENYLASMAVLLRISFLVQQRPQRM